MRHDLNIDLIFPIKDEVSGWLMCVKAEALYEVRIIDTDEIDAVLERAAAVLDQAPKQGSLASGPVLTSFGPQFNRNE